MLSIGLSQDRYDCGACLVRDGEVLFAANEERYTRQKTQGGFPHRCLDACLVAADATGLSVDRVAVAGRSTPPLVARGWPDAYERLSRGKYGVSEGPWRVVLDGVAHHLPSVQFEARSRIGRGHTRLLELTVRPTLPAQLKDVPLVFVEHHRAHAAGALALSGMDPALCVTADGMGDGLSLTVSRRDGPVLQRLWSVSSRHSLGLFFEAVTEALGFTPCRHEGKVTGLAATGDAQRVQVVGPFVFASGNLRYTGPRGLSAVRWIRGLARSYDPADVAAWAQEILESTMRQVVAHWLSETGLRCLVVAGGVFANVKLNQRLSSLPAVEAFFVHPNMGDGGLALGAVCAAGGVELGPVHDVMLGDEFSAQSIERELTAGRLKYQRVARLEEEVATLLSKGYLVARYQGRMEWGPRALGNRSILARSSDKAIARRLNDLLGRNDFMPFAPAVPVEDASAYFHDVAGACRAAEFMTLCFDVTERTRREHPAIVHVDGTARPQFVSSERHPGFHRLLTHYRAVTGTGMLLNTSFNIHEDPIVRTPQEAVTAFVAARLDFMQIGPYLVTADHVRVGDE